MGLHIVSPSCPTYLHPVAMAQSTLPLRYFMMLTILYAFASGARAAVLDSLRYHAGLTLTASSGSETPFWLVSNRQGLSNVRSDFGYARVGLDKPMAYDRRWSWGAAADVALGWRMQSVLTVQQLYVEGRYRCLGAYLGSKELPDIFGAKGLSSGNLLYSGNSRPIPQLRIGIFDYAPIWGLKGWLSAKGYLSFGRFTDSKWQKSWYASDAKRTEDVLYHSKGLWLRNGNPDLFPLTLECGIEMATQFGGISYHDGEIIRMPHGLKAWLKALVPMGGDATTPTQEQTNVQGNMTGCWDFKLAWTPRNSDWAVSAYYEHYFEDHSQLYIEYAWKDGLWGFEGQLPANPVIDRIVYEYLYTKDQTTSVYWDKNHDIPEQVSGRDNYYNHYIYAGWQHWGMGIGNPLVLSPIWNNDRQSYFRTTRVQGHHLGISGSPLPWLGYRLLTSYTRNWGNYAATEYGGPFDKVEDCFSMMAEVTWRPQRKTFSGWEAGVAVAADTGSLLGGNFGVMLTVSKTGWLNLKRNKR